MKTNVRVNQASLFGFLAFIVGFFATLFASWIAEDLNVVAAIAIGGVTGAIINMVLMFTEVGSE